MSRVMERLRFRQQDEQDQIIRDQVFWNAYLFARDIPGADIDALQQVVIDHGNGMSAYSFAAGVPGADLKALEKVVIDRGCDWSAYLFAGSITGSDIPSLQAVVIERGGASIPYLFAKYIPGADIQALRVRLVDLAEQGKDMGNLAKFDVYFPRVATVNSDDDLMPSAAQNTSIQPYSRPSNGGRNMGT